MSTCFKRTIEAFFQNKIDPNQLNPWAKLGLILVVGVPSETLTHRQTGVLDGHFFPKPNGKQYFRANPYFERSGVVNENSMEKNEPPRPTNPGSAEDCCCPYSGFEVKRRPLQF